MEWEVIIHNDHKYIEIVTRGFLDKDSSMDMAKTIAETMRRHRLTKALIDHRNISNVPGEIIDIYERPKKLFRIIVAILGIRIAEIINPDHSKHFKFLETVMRNQGYKFSIFFERSNPRRSKTFVLARAFCLLISAIDVGKRMAQVKPNRSIVATHLILVFSLPYRAKWIATLMAVPIPAPATSKRNGYARNI